MTGSLLCVVSYEIYDVQIKAELVYELEIQSFYLFLNFFEKFLRVLRILDNK